jgi:hypothetical protein
MTQQRPVVSHFRWLGGVAASPKNAPVNSPAPAKGIRYAELSPDRFSDGHWIYRTWPAHSGLSSPSIRGSTRRRRASDKLRTAPLLPSYLPQRPHDGNPRHQHGSGFLCSSEQALCGDLPMRPTKLLVREGQRCACQRRTRCAASCLWQA